METFRSFTFSVCTYLNKMKDFETLLLFQELMKDWTRAGLTCIKLYVEGSLDIQKKEVILDKAMVLKKKTKKTSSFLFI